MTSLFFMTVGRWEYLQLMSCAPNWTSAGSVTPLQPGTAAEVSSVAGHFLMYISLAQCTWPRDSWSSCTNKVRTEDQQKNAFIRKWFCASRGPVYMSSWRLIFGHQILLAWWKIRLLLILSSRFAGWQAYAPGNRSIWVFNTCLHRKIALSVNGLRIPSRVPNSGGQPHAFPPSMGNSTNLERKQMTGKKTIWKGKIRHS